MASVGWGASGWRYLQVPLSDAVDRSAPDYDDSGWSVGTAPFGSRVGQQHPVLTTGLNMQTFWALTSAMWIRRTIPGTTRAIAVKTRMDNDVTLYWNGHFVGLFVGVQEYVFNVPPEFVSPVTNTFALRAADEQATSSGDYSYLDCSISGPTVAPPARQFPRNDGMAASSARRAHPPPTSQQRSPREGPGAYL